MLKILLKLVIILASIISILFGIAHVYGNELEYKAAFYGRNNNYTEITEWNNLGEIDEININLSNGDNINGIFVQNDSDKFAYYFHGTGGSLGGFYYDIKRLYDLGYNVFAYNYPQYGKSVGELNQANVLHFSNTFYEYVKEKKGFDDKNILIYGYSIGTAVAIDFAKYKDFDKLILVTPLDSTRGLAKNYIGFAPQSLFGIKNKFVSADSIKLISEPTLIIHGNLDSVISIDSGKQVFENSGAKEKYFIEADSASHTNVFETYGIALRFALRKFVLGEENDFPLENGKIFKLDRNNKNNFGNFNSLQNTEKSQDLNILEPIKIVENLINENSSNLENLNNLKIPENNLINDFTAEQKKLIEEKIREIQNQNKLNTSVIPYKFAPKLLDFKNDESITKFVSREISFNNLEYFPQDLVDIKNEKINVLRNLFLRKEAFENLKNLSEKFEEDLGEKILIISAFRDFNYQKGIKERGCEDEFCANPGFSEHQTGLAIDIFEATTKENWEKNEKLQKVFNWMNENAADFGFHNSYKNGVEIDGYEIEPWHWRYVGKDFAKFLKDENFSFGEFYNNL